MGPLSKQKRSRIPALDRAPSRPRPPPERVRGALSAHVRLVERLVGAAEPSGRAKWELP